MDGFGPIVSSRLSFYNDNPTRAISLSEVDHEIATLKERKQIAGVTAVVGGVISIIALAGILGFASFLVGALLAIAMVSAFFAYCCKSAEDDLNAKKQDWVIASPQDSLVGADKVGRAAEAVRQ